ncbi:unnamed protein product [Linum tenue]|uniref:Protein SCAR n=1 Tax=Linum tenue TaxID=586396 RepID=A0AAV0PWX4_9ROSI|nr:unnamed protein product [Linum tenue]
MPLTRYQIRNEYGLADPELYRAADRDDPEALLEGVAMAGLVGVLRQLGDLAEFAAEIFHNLHEEVMTTAARGHSLMARVQQLEAEVPSVEKAFLSLTDHSSFYANGAGVDWRPNLHMEQNLITQGDLPRFVMDSYEECRGPPRLFLLDKFDVAGAGACLKRYTDPSIFRIEATSSTTMEMQREKKARKLKKKGRWRNGETPEVTPASHAKLHQLFLEERVANGHSDPARVVKLKRRQLNGSPFDMKSGKSYMEKFLETLSPDNKAVYEDSVNPPLSTLSQYGYKESGLEIVEITAVSPVKPQVDVLQHDEFNGDDPDKWLVKVSDTVTDCETDESSPSSVHKMPIGQELAIYAGGGKSESSEGDQFDDMISEVENYMDALTTMESEIETDTEYKFKKGGVLKFVRREAESDINQERRHDIQVKFLNSQSFGNSSTSDDGNSSIYKVGSSISVSDSQSHAADNVQSDGEGPSKVCCSREDSIPETSTLQSDCSSTRMVACTIQESHELEVSIDIFSEEEKITKLVPTISVANPFTVSLAGEDSGKRTQVDGVTTPRLEPDLETNVNLDSSSVGSSEIPWHTKQVVAPSKGSSEYNSMSDQQQEDPKALPLYLSYLDSVQSSHDDPLHDVSETNYSGDAGIVIPHQLPSEHDNMVEEATNVNDVNGALLKATLLSGSQFAQSGQLNSEPETKKLEEDISVVSGKEEMLSEANAYGIVAEDSYECFDESGLRDLTDKHNTITEADQLKDVVTPVSIPPASDEHGYDTICPSSKVIGSPSSHPSLDDQHQTAVDLHQKISSETEPEAQNEVIPKDREFSHGESIFGYPVLPVSVGGVDASGEQVSGVDADHSVLEPQPVFSSKEASEGDGLFPIAGTLEMSAVHVNEVTFESEEYSAHDMESTSDPSYLAESGITSERAWDLHPDQTDESCPEPDEAGGFTSSNLQFKDMQTLPPGLGTLSTAKDVNVDEAPPLPPLPPMQWRMGNFQPASPSLQTACFGHCNNLPMQPFSADEHTKPYHPFPTNIIEDCQMVQCLSVDDSIGNSAEQQNHTSFELASLANAANIEQDSHQPSHTFPSNIIEDSQKVPCLPMDDSVEDTLKQPNTLPVELQSVANAANLKQESHPLEELDPLNPFVTSEEIPNERPELIDFPSGDPEQSSSESFPSATSMSNASSEAELVPSFQEKAPEESLPPGSLAKEQQQQKVVASYGGGTSWPPTTLALPPSYELGKAANGNKLPRPRNPLIDAVAAVDKSKLRKAAERVQPQASSNAEERDSLLEQIRTKSFNLKPAAVSRPSMRPSMPGIHGPKTNLRVAAILEKANAIRQALAGSDEDDDDDSWSDS